IVRRQRDHVDPIDALDQRESLARAAARMLGVDEYRAKDAVVVAGRARAEPPFERAIVLGPPCRHSLVLRSIVLGHRRSMLPRHAPQCRTPSFGVSQRDTLT